MKRIFYLFLLMCFINFANTQNVQQGKIVEHNSGGKPIANVSIRVQGAPATISDNNGNFKLTFNYLKSGQKINVEDIYKKDYEIVNQKELDNWKLSPSETHVLILCKKQLLDEARMQHYNIGEQAIKKNYQNLKNEYEQLLVAQKITLLEYQDKLDEAFKERTFAIEQLAILADKFARVNRENCDTLHQKAMQLFTEGKLKESVAIFEKEQNLSKLALKQKQQEEANEDIRSLVELLKTENEYRAVLGGKEQYDRIAKNLKEIIEIDPENVENLLLYAHCLLFLRDFEAAISLAKNAEKKSQNAEERLEALLLLSQIYNHKEDFVNLEKITLKALELEEKLPKPISEKSQILVALLYNQIGKFDIFQLKLPDFEQYLHTSIHHSLAVAQIHSKYLLTSLLNFGTYYVGIGQYERAIVKFKECLQHIDNQNKFNEEQKNHYVVALTNLGTCYNKIGNVENAEFCFQKSYQLATEISVENFGYQCFSLAAAANNLATFYYKIQEFEKSISYLQEAVAIYEINNQKSMLLTDILTNLANSYSNVNKLDSALLYFKKAVENAETVSEMEQLQSASEYAFAHFQLAVFYQKNNEILLSIEHFQKAIKIYDRLYKINPTSNALLYVHCINSLASSVIETNNKEGVKLYEKAEKIAKKYLTENPLDLNDALATINNNLGFYYGGMADYKKGLKYFYLASNQFDELSKINFETYIKKYIGTRCNIAIMEERSKKYDVSETIYLDFIPQLRDLATKNALAFQSDLARYLNAFANLYFVKGNYEQSKIISEESIQLFQQLFNSNPNFYQTYIDKINKRLAEIDLKE